VYKFIENLPSNWKQYSQTELKTLGQVWQERKAALAQSDALEQFTRRLRREWAIETGIIERLYTWDRGVTELLLEQGIEASLIANRGGLRREEAERVAALIHDQESIIQGLFEFVNGKSKLTEHYIRSMHAQFTAHQDTVEALAPDGRIMHVPLLKGDYKRLANNPRRPDGSAHEYCPPEFVKDEMARLITWYHAAEAKDVSPELLSAWLHHRFTQIHPFQDGNGRLARALATLVFLKYQLFPLVIRDADRTLYIDALEMADRGDLWPLIKLFARRQKEAILQALGIEQSIQAPKARKEIVNTAIHSLKRRADQVRSQWKQVFAVAAALHKQTASHFRSVATELKQELRTVKLPGERYDAVCAQALPEDERSQYYYRQIVLVAKALGYYANRSWYRSWVLLDIHTTERFELLVTFHGVGHEFQGVLVASAMTFRRLISDEDSKPEIVEAQPACTEVFQFNYAETEKEVSERFNEWLREVVVIGLEQWRRSLET
jgi:prophage maintenance system killer protein